MKIATLITLGLTCLTVAVFAQNQDANPYGHRYYNDHNDYRMYGTNVLPRTDHANLDTLTNVIKGDLRYDTLNSVVVYYDGSTWVNVISGGGNTLDEAYDSGGAGAGRTITADAGAVKISGEDGLLVTGTFGSGADSEWSGAGTGMFFNPKKAAFRAGYVSGMEWDNANVGDYSFAGGRGTKASGLGSFSFGNDSESTGDYSFSVGESGASGYQSAAICNSSATGNYSFSAGSSESFGDNSFSMGIGITSESYAETAIGLNNTNYTPTSTSAWEATDRLFVIGNGTDNSNRSDALVMLKDGSTGFGTSTPSATIDLVGTLQYVDGTQADGYVLTSDASGNASWIDPSTLDFSTVPAYTDNTAAEAVLGAGKLYYTDVAGEYMLKVTH